MFRNVIFDWSGTLCNDLGPVVETINRILQEYGHNAIEQEEFLDQFRLPFAEFYAEKIPHATADELEGHYNSFFPLSQKSAEPIPHAREILDYLSGRGTRIFLLSAVTAEHFAEQAEQLGFQHCFEQTYLAVRDKRQRIHDLLEENGLKPEETAFVGDMCHDIDAARAAGITSVAVLTGYDSANKLSLARPDLMLSDLSQLQQWISRADPLEQMPVSTVGALIYNPEGKVLLVRSHKWSHRWGIPGGKIKRGEGSEAALHREILEETNLPLEEVKLVLVQDCVEPEEFERSAHFILLNYTARTSGTKLSLNEEAQEYAWEFPEKALEYALNQPTRILIEHVQRTAEV